MTRIRAEAQFLSVASVASLPVNDQSTLRRLTAVVMPEARRFFASLASFARGREIGAEIVTPGRRTSPRIDPLGSCGLWCLFAAQATAQLDCFVALLLAMTGGSDHSPRMARMPRIRTKALSSSVKSVVLTAFSGLNGATRLRHGRNDRAPTTEEHALAWPRVNPPQLPPAPA